MSNFSQDKLNLLNKSTRSLLFDHLNLLIYIYNLSLITIDFIWISTNPGLKFNRLFILVCSA